jgi:hypothetical protein
MLRGGSVTCGWCYWDDYVVLLLQLCLELGGTATVMDGLVDGVMQQSANASETVLY